MGNALTPIYDYLAPDPNADYGTILPFAKDRTTGAVRAALPETIRNGLLGYLDLANATGTGSLTGNALTALTMGGMGAGALGAPRGALAVGSARLTKDQLWDKYHQALQYQISLPPDRQHEMALKVKLLRQQWEKAPELPNALLPRDQVEY